MALGLSTENMLYWRFLVSFALLSVFYPKIVFCFKRMPLVQMGLAVLGFVVSAFFYFECSNLIGTGLAMTVFFIYPMVLALLNFIFLKETVPMPQKIGMVLAFIALVFLTDFDFNWQGSLFWGFILGMFAGSGYALYIFLTKTTHLHPIALTAWICAGAALFFGVHSFSTESLITVPMTGWFDVVLLAIVCTLIPIVLFIKAVHLIGNIKASLLSIVEPATTILLGMLYFNESFSFVQCIGLFFMCLSIFVIESKKMTFLG